MHSWMQYKIQKLKNYQILSFFFLFKIYLSNVTKVYLKWSEFCFFNVLKIKTFMTKQKFRFFPKYLFVAIVLKPSNILNFNIVLVKQYNKAKSRY